MSFFSRVHATVLLALLSAPVAAAEPFLEFRAYPAGQIMSAGLSWPLGPRTEWAASALYNRAERGSAGKHADESGDGFGFGAELSQFWQHKRSGWFYGARTELFELDINWKDAGRQGTTSLLVLQPTARIGYRSTPFIRGLRAELVANLGVEINLRTDGEKVGEGPIGLLSIVLRFE